MTAEEFDRWLSSLVEQGRLEPGDAHELVEARTAFDGRRDELLSGGSGRVVGVARGEVLQADTVPELLAQARAMSSLVYFERRDEELLSVDDREPLG